MASFPTSLFVSQWLLGEIETSEMYMRNAFLQKEGVHIREEVKVTGDFHSEDPMMTMGVGLTMMVLGFTQMELHVTITMKNREDTKETQEDFSYYRGPRDEPHGGRQMDFRYFLNVLKDPGQTGSPALQTDVRVIKVLRGHCVGTLWSVFVGEKPGWGSGQGHWDQVLVSLLRPPVRLCIGPFKWRVKGQRDWRALAEKQQRGQEPTNRTGPPLHARSQGPYHPARSVSTTGPDPEDNFIQVISDDPNKTRKKGPFPPIRDRSPARRDIPPSPHSRSGSSVSSRSYSPERSKVLPFSAQQGKNRERPPGPSVSASRDGSPHSTASKVYRQDCETFGMVVKMLVAKDASLEKHLQSPLKDNLIEIRERCLEDLKNFIAELDEVTLKMKKSTLNTSRPHHGHKSLGSDPFAPFPVEQRLSELDDKGADWLLSDKEECRF
ncbi:hypothetical protein DNTS_028701 [Danionella cerebrum]|uniref:Periphilin-1 C-terminal domain-containing protein n=1 Tax=Danionella cerebrum TaxID=2873325 RepID=A0A553NGW2_9TELE|nr:hypothetical protein DNTS_028701 [Danionella translucida]